MVESALLSIALARCIDQCQVLRRAQASIGLGLQKALLQRHGNFFGKTNTDKATGGHGVAVVD